MAGRFGLVSLAVVAALALSLTAACAANSDRTIEKPSTTGTVTEGTETYRGFILDNVLHSPHDGDIHYNAYIPESYDGSKPYALFFTLPGYEGLYFQGVGVNRFSPDGTFTRAQLATVLYRMAGSPAVTGKDSFTDTADDAWYAPAVLWAAQNKVVNGIGSGQFGPERATTQEQLVTMLYRDAGEPESNAATDASNWAAKAVGWARNEGLVSRKELAFEPKAEASRAQIAFIVSQYLKVETPLQESLVATAKKALVVYFSAADNDGIDAVSAATVVAHEGKDYGSAQLAAKFIGDYTGADVSAIVTEQSYPAEYNAMADMAKEQRDNGEHPALKSKLESLAD